MLRHVHNLTMFSTRLTAGFHVRLSIAVRVLSCLIGLMMLPMYNMIHILFSVDDQKMRCC